MSKNSKKNPKIPKIPMIPVIPKFQIRKCENFQKLQGTNFSDFWNSCIPKSKTIVLAVFDFSNCWHLRYCKFLQLLNFWNIGDVSFFGEILELWNSWNLEFPKIQDHGSGHFGICWNLGPCGTS